MAFSDMQSAIADELARADLSTEIKREINNAITFYGNKAFWFNEATMAPITTVQGQRYYPLPANFASVLDVLSTIGNYTYRLEARTEQYLDQIDWGNSFWSGYPTDYSFWNGQIRLFPPPQGGLPVQVKGSAILAPQPLVNDVDTNAWLTSAEELIRTRARTTCDRLGAVITPRLELCAELRRRFQAIPASHGAEHERHSGEVL